MTTTNRTIPAPPIEDDACPIAAPAWVSSLCQTTAPKTARVDELELSISQGPGGTLSSIRLPNAIRLSAETLEERTIAIHRLLQNGLRTSRHPWPARFWNYLPGIHDSLDPQRDRYMVFNGGRLKAFCQWWGNGLFPKHVPTASAVGHRGTDLIVHCLSTARPGIPIENPRQIPAFGYSKRYGPLPPCFARATLLGSQLLIGGTASIRGEQTMHAKSLASQTDETLANIASLVRAAYKSVGKGSLDDAAALATLSSVRIYSPAHHEQDRIVRAARKSFSSAGEIEFIVANLCRAELLIEIEGVAAMINV